MLYALAGSLVLLLAVVDLVWTTLSAAGGGPFSRGVARGTWRLTGGTRLAGPLGLLLTAVLWVGLLWGGWTLVFMAAPEAAVNATTGEPADFWSRVYFGGYTVATLGLGDYVPKGALWQVLTVVAAFSGLVLITLAVTYYTAVLGAVVDKQRLAANIHSLGDGPADLVARAWDGEGFSALDTILPSLSDQFALHTRRHYAYPVVHYFRAGEARHAVAVQTARLWDALLLWQHAVEEVHRPPPAALRMARRSLEGLVDMLESGYVDPAEDAPSRPDLRLLREAGVPLADAADRALQADEDRVRRLLLGYVRHEGYRWQHVTGF